MKKNRHNDQGSFQAAGQLPKKSGTENIPVILVLAIVLLAASVFSSQRRFQQKYKPQTLSDTAEKYVWLTGSPDIPDGLYLFTEQQLAGNLPGAGSLLAGEAARDMNPMVAAVQYHAGTPQPAALPPAVANIFFQPIPINRADADILTSLPGIGPMLAEKIVRRREQHGPFRSKDELLHIAGIGPKKYEALAALITLE